MNWILLSERLPEVGKVVLIANDQHLGVAERYTYGASHEHWHWSGEGFSGYEWERDFEPTHWAELPELPEPL